MAALAFTAYGVHWFAIGRARAFGGDPRPNAFMAVGFTVISVLGIVVFFKADDWPVGLLFIGLTCIYVSDFSASLFMHVPSRPVPAGPGAAPASVSRPEPTRISEMGERSLGFFHLITGGWLMYLTFAVRSTSRAEPTSGFDRRNRACAEEGAVQPKRRSRLGPWSAS